MNTFWITFYSYKGGVGRTMALANIAALLAKEGRRVLLIDFDLEAPGLDAFSEFGIPKSHPGVVEYVTEYLNTGKSSKINDFILECSPKDVHLRGKLWLMPSGKKDTKYNCNRARINWSDLYDHYDGERFVENWKADIQRTYSPDYVLIDSRTGLTDVAGMCTLHFPQLVVLLYALNDQNIQGIANVAHAISKAEGTRSPQLLTVATPVPQMLKERTGLLQERLGFAEKELGVAPQCQIHYDARVPLKEGIFVWDDFGGRLAIEYIELKEKIIEYDMQGLDFFLKESKRAVRELDQERAFAVNIDLEANYKDRAESYYQIANACRAFGRINEVEINLRKSVDLDAYFSPAFEALVAILKVQKKLTEATEVCRARIQKLSNATQAGRNAIEATLFIWGEFSMMTCDYASAFDIYEKLRSNNNKFNSLAVNFNYIESKRRLGLMVSVSEWRQITDLYEGEVERERTIPVSERINHMQAMHIAYAMSGKIERARQLLEQAQELLNTVSPRERIFSVVEYTQVQAEQIIRDNKQMIMALDSKKLWDGTVLRYEPAG